MSDWRFWFIQDTRQPGLFECTPIEFRNDGGFNVITGMCLLTSIEELKKRADKIWKVDDIWNPESNADLVYDQECNKEKP